MARTLFLLSGKMEVVLDPEQTLKDLIGEHLGQECEDLFIELLENAKDPYGHVEEMERIADGYLSMLRDTMDELSGVLQEFDNPRLNRAKVHCALQNIWKNLYGNL